MPSTTSRIARTVAMAIVATLWSLDAAKADPPSDQHGSVILENLWITSAKTGGRSILRFRIINEGHDHAHFLGVDTPVATDAKIIARVSDQQTRVLESIGIQAENELDLTTSHMWIELGPLTRDLEAGESIPVALVFVQGHIGAEAHVHAAGG